MIQQKAITVALLLHVHDVVGEFVLSTFHIMYEHSSLLSSFMMCMM
jgi:hypothetical protein